MGLGQQYIECTAFVNQKVKGKSWRMRFFLQTYIKMVFRRREALFYNPSGAL